MTDGKSRGKLSESTSFLNFKSEYLVIFIGYIVIFIVIMQVPFLINFCQHLGNFLNRYISAGKIPELIFFLNKKKVSI